jgi:formate dehydrogenase major subunit
MSERIQRDDVHFTLDGEAVTASPYETIWQVAQRLGKSIPHLCYKDSNGYRPDGNCRSCLVEIDGSLEVSCRWKPQEAMKVLTDSPLARKARESVYELLLTDQPPRDQAHDPDSQFWYWAEKVGVTSSRYPRRDTPIVDNSNPAITVNLDACIHCKLCIKGCSEVQGHDVIGMHGRGVKAKIGFDFDDPMGNSTCVFCGECIQACPTGALMPASLLNEEQVLVNRPDKKVDSVCPYCGVGCQITFNIKDNEILYIEGQNGPANNNRLCVKGRFGLDYVKHPHRLTKPLIRRDDAPAKIPGLEIDPANPLTHFREASWEEALEVAADGLKKVLERDGNSAMAGFGSAKCSNEEAYLFQKLIRTGFGTNNIDHCTRLCHASSVAALLEGVGSAAVSAPFTAALDADVIIVIGANPVENHPVAATFFRNAADLGATLFVMDPRLNDLSRHATQFLQFKPGSDVALLNAMLYTIIREELYDRHFIERYTTGFEALKIHIEDYSPEKMAPICGIDADTIRTVARKYATMHRSIIFWGMGIAQSIHGTDNARCLIALAMVTGQIGRHGTGLHPLRGQNNVQGASDCGLIPFVFPDYQAVDNPDIHAKFEKFWNAELNPMRGLTMVEIIDEACAGSINGMYFMGENPAMSDPDTEHVREALACLDFLVIQDIFLTETAAFADVLLPATAWSEKDGTATNTNRQVQMGRKALDAPGEARPDWWITQELAKRLGLDWNYERPKDVFNEMRKCMPSIENISWERLLKENVVTYPCSGDDDPGQDIVFTDGFPKEDGRGIFIPVSITPDNEPPDDEYPMILSTVRNMEHWHTGVMTRRSRVLDDLEPEAFAMLCKEDMVWLGLKPGDYARISTRRGSVDIRIRYDYRTPVGVVNMSFCWAEAPANLLTSTNLDPVGKIPSAKYCAARVEKITVTTSKTVDEVLDEITG